MDQIGCYSACTCSQDTQALHRGQYTHWLCICERFTPFSDVARDHIFLIRQPIHAVWHPYSAHACGHAVCMAYSHTSPYSTVGCMGCMGMYDVWPTLRGGRGGARGGRDRAHADVALAHEAQRERVRVRIARGLSSIRGAHYATVRSRAIAV